MSREMVTDEEQDEFEDEESDESIEYECKALTGR